jgi:FKBP-type peptidyl-prolyl cis-trans isomerase
MNKLDNKHTLKAPLRGWGVILLLPLLLLSFTACNEDDDSTTQWRLDNQAKYDEIKANPEWKEMNTKAVEGPSGVYYKVLPNLDAEGVEKVKGTEHPLQTASVTVNYTGKNYIGTVFDAGTNATFKVNGVVRGFSIALQNMVVGDKLEICIPYYLGYGTTVTGTIKAYSTLFFEIELLKIDQYPK